MPTKHFLFADELSRAHPSRSAMLVNIHRMCAEPNSQLRSKRTMRVSATGWLDVRDDILHRLSTLRECDKMLFKQREVA